MSDRTYTFTFKGEILHVETSDGLLDEHQAANIIRWFATEIKPHAPSAALHELIGIIRPSLTTHHGHTDG